ncbi:hypothetical protein [Herbaspirillum sp. CF444]|nr:hypothetical protein [Herbaspirillum sp. CF444]
MQKNGTAPGGKSWEDMASYGGRNEKTSSGWYEIARNAKAMSADAR